MPTATVLPQPDVQVWRLLNLSPSEQQPQSVPPMPLDAPTQEKKAERVVLAVWLL